MQLFYIIIFRNWLLMVPFCLLPGWYLQAYLAEQDKIWKCFFLIISYYVISFYFIFRRNIFIIINSLLFLDWNVGWRFLPNSMALSTINCIRDLITMGKVKITVWWNIKNFVCFSVYYSVWVLHNPSTANEFKLSWCIYMQF